MKCPDCEAVMIQGVYCHETGCPNADSKALRLPKAGVDYHPASWAMEVIADSTGKWCGNAVRLSTKLECDNYGLDLAMRWTAVSDVRSVPSDDPVGYRWTPDGLKKALK